MAHPWEVVAERRWGTLLPDVINIDAVHVHQVHNHYNTLWHISEVVLLVMYMHSHHWICRAFIYTHVPPSKCYLSRFQYCRLNQLKCKCTVMIYNNYSIVGNFGKCETTHSLALAKNFVIWMLSAIGTHVLIWIGKFLAWWFFSPNSLNC